jgi:regulator of protease activity HflC (stomatin/prohibitin superfamily)
MEQNFQRISLVNWLALLVAAALSVALARFAETIAGLVASVFLGLGFLVAAVSTFQLRLEAREREEAIEFEELKKAKGDSALFADTESFSARRSREQFERFLVPAFAVLLLALQGAALWTFWRWIPKAEPAGVNQASVAMAIYALFALLLLLLGKYSSGIARLEHQPLLRPGAGYLLLGSVVCFLMAALEAAVWFGAARADAYLAYGFLGLLALVALETLISLIMEIYRPRVRGQRTRVLYESRLIGLLGQPAGLITTAAQALDYQFGFKVSETWFYRFLERALSWIVLLQLGALFFSTTFVIVEPDEQALLERFGRPVTDRPVLGPGLHLKWPWPIDQAYRYPTRRIQNFLLGAVPDADLNKERTVLWTRPHYKEEFNLLVASRDEVPAGMEGTVPVDAPKAAPANLLAASMPVHYEVVDLAAWTYGHRDAGRMLEEIANREVMRHMVSVDFETVMSTGRLGTGESLRTRIQAQADRLGLGVRIVYIGLENIHPPIGTRDIQVAAAFQQVVGAMQQRETNILSALAYQAQRLPAAQGEATNLLTQAAGERVAKVTAAAAEAERFQQQEAAYRASPAAYRQRVYLDTLTRTIGPVPKYVLAATNTTDVMIVNLEERVRSDLASGVILPPDALPPTRPAQP